MATAQTYNVRPLAQNELNIVLEWAAAEGWNPSKYDAACYYKADPRGFLLGELDGEPISCISAVVYDDNFGFIAFYIVRPEYRGQGYGSQILQAAFVHLGQRCVGLDSVLAQRENYQKVGFQPAHRIVRYQGQGFTGHLTGCRSVALDNFDRSAVSAYEKTLFAPSRPEFLEGLLSQPKSTALGIITAGRLAGYGVIRLCGNGYKIGPLFADDEESAADLLLALAAQAGEKPVFLDTPESNPAAVGLAEKLGMKPVFETVRMYTQTSPDISLQRIYGIGLAAAT